MVSRPHHPGFRTRDDTLMVKGGQEPPYNRDKQGGDLVQLLEADVLGVLMEALPAKVQVVFPDETMAVAASLALARPGVPNIVVTHPGGWSSSAHSLVEVNQAIK